MPPTPTPPRRPLRRVDETSAGGLVLDRRGPEARGALIGRLDRRGRLLWSLPKGHVEAGETEGQGAVRRGRRGQRGRLGAAHGAGGQAGVRGRAPPAGQGARPLARDGLTSPWQ